MNGATSRYRELVAEALEAIEIRSPTAFTWFGTPAAGLPPEAETSLAPDEARAYLLHSLQGQLYARFYCSGRALPHAEEPQPGAALGFSPFVQGLSRANAGTGALEPGWRFEREDDDRLVVSRDGLAFWAHRQDVRAAGGALEPGSAVSVRLPKELLKLSPGFYMALGEGELPVHGHEPIVRFYFNLRSEGAAPLVSLLTHRLADARVAFRLKVVSEPERYTRCDAGVLYVRRRDYAASREVVAGVYPDVAPLLKPATPALTKQLAPGLALAEEPADGIESFGTSRCMLLADAIVQAHGRGLENGPDRVSVIAATFAQAGLSLDTPYLNPGSADDYVFAAP